MITIDNDVKLDYSDVFLVPKQSKIESRSEVSLTQFLPYFTHVVPIIVSNMDHVGTFAMAEELSKYKVMTALVKHYSLEQLLAFYTKNRANDIPRHTFFSIGINDVDLIKLREFYKLNADNQPPGGICIDVANGYSDKFIQVAADVVSEFGGEALIMAGNVVTPEVVERLYNVGVRMVKIGIGPGSACSTRRETGIGYPQFSAVMECVSAARELNGGVLICADGGITGPGDCVKAFAAGADTVMIGGAFAGHNEGYTPEELASDKLPFYGMASAEAQTLHNGGLNNYRASEGKSFTLPKRGYISGTIQHYLGGIRSGLSYQGARNLQTLRKSPRFIRVSRQMNGVYDRYEN